MWHVDGYSRIPASVIALALLVISGAYAQQTQFPGETEIPTQTEMAIPSDVTERIGDPQIPSGPQQPMMFSGNKFSDLFKELQGDKVALKTDVPGCPVLVSPADDGSWTVEDFGVDYVTRGKAEGSGARTYPIGRLCLRTVDCGGGVDTAYCWGSSRL